MRIIDPMFSRPSSRPLCGVSGQESAERKSGRLLLGLGLDQHSHNVVVLRYEVLKGSSLWRAPPSAIGYDPAPMRPPTANGSSL
jgi:hypothetical protein